MGLTVLLHSDGAGPHARGGAGGRRRGRRYSAGSLASGTGATKSREANKDAGGTVASADAAQAAGAAGPRTTSRRRRSLVGVIGGPGKVGVEADTAPTTEGSQTNGNTSKGRKIRKVCWHRDRSWCAALAARSRRIEIWDVQCQLLVRSASLQGYAASDAIDLFFQDRDRLVVVCNDGFAVFDTALNTMRYQSIGATGNVTLCTPGVPISRHLFVFGSTDGFLRVWDIQREQVVAVLPEHHTVALTCLCSGAEGEVVSGDRNGLLAVWTVQVGKASQAADFAAQASMPLLDDSGRVLHHHVRGLQLSEGTAAAHDGRVVACRWDERTQALYSAGGDGVVVRWPGSFSKNQTVQPFSPDPSGAWTAVSEPIVLDPSTHTAPPDVVALLRQDGSIAFPAQMRATDWGFFDELSQDSRELSVSHAVRGPEGSPAADMLAVATSRGLVVVELPKPKHMHVDNPLRDGLACISFRIARGNHLMVHDGAPSVGDWHDLGPLEITTSDEKHPKGWQSCPILHSQWLCPPSEVLLAAVWESECCFAVYQVRRVDRNWEISERVAAGDGNCATWAWGFGDDATDLTFVTGCPAQFQERPPPLPLRPPSPASPPPSSSSVPGPPVSSSKGRSFKARRVASIIGTSLRGSTASNTRDQEQHVKVAQEPIGHVEGEDGGQQGSGLFVEKPPCIVFHRFERTESGRVTKVIKTERANTVCDPEALFGQGPLLLVRFGAQQDTAWTESLGGATSCAEKARFFHWARISCATDSEEAEDGTLLVQLRAAGEPFEPPDLCAWESQGLPYEADLPLAQSSLSCALTYGSTIEMLTLTTKLCRSSGRAELMHHASATAHGLGRVLQLLWFHGTLWLRFEQGLRAIFWTAAQSEEAFPIVALEAANAQASKKAAKQLKEGPVRPRRNKTAATAEEPIKLSRGFSTAERAGMRVMRLYEVPNTEACVALVGFSDGRLLVLCEARGSPAHLNVLDIKEPEDSFFRFAMLVSAGLAKDALPWARRIAPARHQELSIFLEERGFVEEALRAEYLTGVDEDHLVNVAIRNLHFETCMSLVERAGPNSSWLLEPSDVMRCIDKADTVTLGAVAFSSESPLKSKQALQSAVRRHLCVSGARVVPLKRLAIVLAAHADSSLLGTSKTSERALHALTLLGRKAVEAGNFLGAQFVARLLPGPQAAKLAAIAAEGLKFQEQHRIITLA
ncbi:Endoplasmic reticulum lectin 1 [Durusdinium trenchii]|uniref:Endoplasmic reticulum lectin 1 n=1 Tax=Durusdinium trenchii TaxID=1381693 RepID=A0ABP0H5U0_9DINO